MKTAWTPAKTRKAAAVESLAIPSPVTGNVKTWLWKCHVCGGERFWARVAYGPLDYICVVCHPPVAGQQIVTIAIEEITPYVPTGVEAIELAYHK